VQQRHSGTRRGLSSTRDAERPSESPVAQNSRESSAMVCSADMPMTVPFWAVCEEGRCCYISLVTPAPRQCQV
jgi:hypothetical protein